MNTPSFTIQFHLILRKNDGKYGLAFISVQLKFVKGKKRRFCVKTNPSWELVRYVPCFSIGNRRTFSYNSWLIGFRDVLKVITLHSPFSKHHEYQEPITINGLLRGPINQELYEKAVRFFIYSMLNKISINQSERGNGKLSISSVRVYFMQKPLKFFVPQSDIFERLRLNLGHLLNYSAQLLKSSEALRSPLENSRRLRKSSDQFRKSSDVFRSTSGIVGRLRVDIGNVQITSGQLWKFGCFVVAFQNLWKT